MAPKRSRPATGPVRRTFVRAFKIGVFGVVAAVVALVIAVRYRDGLAARL